MAPPTVDLFACAAPGTFPARWALVCLLGCWLAGCGDDNELAGSQARRAPPPGTPQAAPSQTWPPSGRPPSAAAFPLGILDGNLVQAKEYAATGAILYSSGWPQQTRPLIGAMICSGTLIAPDVVLAAGHCHEGASDRGGASLDYYFSLSSDVSNFGPHVRAFPADAVRVAHFQPHPDYGVVEEGPHKVRHVADLALLFLERPMLQVTPAQVLPANMATSLKVGQEVFIVGYGRRNLQFLGTGDGGLKSYGRSTLHRVDPFELQIGLGPLDAYKCWGDSGGPTFLASPNGALHLVGVTSRAADAGGCRSAGIDTRVDPFRHWIETSMAKACGTPLRPACTEAWRTLPN